MRGFRSWRVGDWLVCVRDRRNWVIGGWLGGVWRLIMGVGLVIVVRHLFVEGDVKNQKIIFVVTRKLVWWNMVVQYVEKYTMSLNDKGA